MKTTKPNIAADFLKLALAVAGVVGSPTSFSQEQSERSAAIGYIFDHDDVPRGLAIPVDAKRLSLQTSRKVTTERMSEAQTTPNVEPVELQVAVDPKRRSALVANLARAGKVDELQSYFERKRLEVASTAAKGETSSPPYFKVTLDAEAVPLVDWQKIAPIYAATHHRLLVPTAPLRERGGQLGKKLLRQMAPFFGTRELAEIQSDITQREALALDRKLLPSFARRTVGLYTKFRGPNCFQAALAFQDPALPWRPDVNSKLEAGYHRALINNDELWWALNRFFVEVDPRQEELRYGDVLVFLDVEDAKKPLSYRWIKHASTYLFGDYVFSKGSNSANSPYSVKTVGEEWDTWAKRTSKLGLKVFRRPFEQPRELAESSEQRTAAGTILR